MRKYTIYRTAKYHFYYSYKILKFISKYILFINFFIFRQQLYFKLFLFLKGNGSNFLSIFSEYLSILWVYMSATSPSKVGTKLCFRDNALQRIFISRRKITLICYILTIYQYYVRNSCYYLLIVFTLSPKIAGTMSRASCLSVHEINWRCFKNV